MCLASWFSYLLARVFCIGVDRLLCGFDFRVDVVITWIDCKIFTVFNFVL